MFDLTGLLVTFLWTEFLGAARGRWGAGLRATGFHLCFSQMMLLVGSFKPGPTLFYENHKTELNERVTLTSGLKMEIMFWTCSKSIPSVQFGGAKN